MAIQVEVWGDYACFTRPEMKTERVSYDIMTPSAARGLLEASIGIPASGGSLSAFMYAVRFALPTFAETR